MHSSHTLARGAASAASGRASRPAQPLKRAGVRAAAARGRPGGERRRVGEEVEGAVAHRARLQLSNVVVLKGEILQVGHVAHRARPQPGDLVVVEVDVVQVGHVLEGRDIQLRDLVLSQLQHLNKYHS